MSLLERRVHLRLDRQSYALVSAEARRSGRSVAAVIREAIDVRFGTIDERAIRARAAARFLERARASSGEPQYATAAGLKAAYETEQIAHLETGSR